MHLKRPILLLLLILLAAGLRCANLYRPGLAMGDEALTALRTLGLVEQGHGWTPYWNGAPDVHKPPLYYWLVASGYRLFGVGVFAIRLPAMISFLVLLALTYGLGRRIYGAGTGLVAALFAALHPTLAAQSCVGMMDTTMIAFSLGAAWFLLNAEERPREYLGWGICCGLALLTKGEAAVPILPASFLYLLAVRRKAFREPRLYAGLALAVLLTGAWFGSQFVLHRDAFLQPHVADNVNYRFQHSWTEAAVYLKSLQYLWASWGGLAPLFFAAPVLAWFGEPRGHRPREALLIVLVGVVPLAMVSLVRQQMAWYMLPTVVPMALFAARVTVRLAGGGYPPALRLLPCALLAAGTWIPGAYRGPAALPGLVTAAAGLAAVLGLGRRERLRRAGGLVFAAGLAAAVVGGLSASNSHVNMQRARDSRSLRELAERLPSVAEAPGRMIVNFRHFPLNALMFHARRDSQLIREFSPQDVAPGTRRVAVLEGGGCREFFQGLDVRSVAEHAGFEILVVENIAPESGVPGATSTNSGAAP